MPSVIRQPLDPSLSVPAPSGAPASSPIRAPLAGAPAPGIGAPPPAPSPAAQPQPQVPWTAKTQADGSIIAQVPNPAGGDPIVIGVYPSPKLPKSLQAQA